ncbi:hypothetical protein [Rubellimicrobium aerolatum]|uniref:Uncharacterized protein n=1 Tax=Rubellimicrobium aerolatum TaxID=490979 RepID=A0ABW0SGJ1_9RHOB|nr:hypothetical protein [Rubellimicrobium aerolatum]MBP1807666.1 hypothetical protein [Rubellimicrobium aerolatum]
MQYHPELSPEELAIALRSQAGDLVEAGLADDQDHVRSRADEIEALHRDPSSRALSWRLGVDGEFADQDGRRRKSRTFSNASRNCGPAQGHEGLG